MLQVSCVQSTPYPLDLFNQVFDGSLAERKTRYTTGQKTIFTWQCSSYSAELFLRAVYPYLRCKRDEADIAFRFRETFGPPSMEGGQTKLTDELIAYRHELMLEMQELRKQKRDQYNVSTT